jgi:hypothetical protein
MTIALLVRPLEVGLVVGLRKGSQPSIVSDQILLLPGCDV